MTEWKCSDNATIEAVQCYDTKSYFYPEIRYGKCMHILLHLLDLVSLISFLQQNLGFSLKHLFFLDEIESLQDIL